MSGEFISQRNFTLRSTTGHAIAFERGVATYVPYAVRPEAMAAGCVPVDSASINTEMVEAERVAPLVVEGQLREAILFATIHEIVQRNSSKEFDSGGRPQTKVIAKKAGFHVSNDEREKVWAKYRQITGSGEELPTHKNSALFIEVSGVDSRKGINDYAELLGVDQVIVDGASIEQARNILLRAVMNMKA